MSCSNFERTLSQSSFISEYCMTCGVLLGSEEEHCKKMKPRTPFLSPVQLIFVVKPPQSLWFSYVFSLPLFSVFSLSRINPCQELPDWFNFLSCDKKLGVQIQEKNKTSSEVRQQHITHTKHTKKHMKLHKQVLM